MTSWDKTKIIIAGIGTILVPVTLGVIAQGFSSAIKKREIEGRFVGIAVDILRNNPSKKNRNLRDWAARIVDEYSGVKLLEKAKTDLIESISIPNEKSNSVAYLIASLRLEDTFIEVIQLIKTVKTLYVFENEELSKRLIIVMADLEADKAKLQAHRASVHNGMIKSKSPSDAELKMIEDLNREVDRMIAKDPEEILDIAKRVLVLLDELEFLK